MTSLRKPLREHVWPVMSDSVDTRWRLKEKKKETAFNLIVLHCILLIYSQSTGTFFLSV